MSYMNDRISEQATFCRPQDLDAKVIADMTLQFKLDDIFEGELIDILRAHETVPTDGSQHLAEACRRALDKMNAHKANHLRAMERAFVAGASTT